MLNSLRANGCCEPNSTYTPKHLILCSQYLSCDWKSCLPINMEGCAGRQTSIGKRLAWVGRLKLKQVDIQWLLATCLTQLHDQSYRITWSEPTHLTLCQHYATHEWILVTNKHGKDVLDSKQTKRCVWNTRQNNLPLLYTSTQDSYIWKITNASTCTTIGPIGLLDLNWAKLTNRTTSNWLSPAHVPTAASEHR